MGKARTSSSKSNPVAQAIAQARQIIAPPSNPDYVPYGGPGHQAMLESGYGITMDEAKEIVRRHEEDPRTWPYNDDVKRAKAMLAAFAATPRAIDTNPHWVRPPGGR